MTGAMVQRAAGQPTIMGPPVSGELAYAFSYAVAVRTLCEFAAKTGDLDLRFTPTPTAEQGQAGHLIVALRRGPDFETEVALSGSHQELRVRGRADGFNPVANELEEVKTFRGRLSDLKSNHQALHWAQLKVYGHLMCQTRGLAAINLTLVYFDVLTQAEYPSSEAFKAIDLAANFAELCQPFLVWARSEMAHRNERNAALATLEFPQKPFRPGQRELAAGVYRTCVDGGALLVQAPTGIGKTVGTLFPALRAMPVRRVDKLFYLTAKTPGRAVALEALHTIGSANPGLAGPGALRVVELIAKDKSCEHPDKACHGESCPLAQGFYDRLPAARAQAANTAWLDQASMRKVALEHSICPYYLSHDMLHWADVVVGDYNYYFDRSAVLWALVTEDEWRAIVLVDEAHNLYSRACAMYSADLTYAEAEVLRPHVPPLIRRRLHEWLNQWQLLLQAHERWQAEQRRQAPASHAPFNWRLLDEVPDAWLRALHKLNTAISEHINDAPFAAHGPLLPFYFRTLGFAALADSYGDHSLCEFDSALKLPVDSPEPQQPRRQQVALLADEAACGQLTLRCVVPATFLAKRLKALDALILFSATLNPAEYYVNLLGLPSDTPLLDIPSPFRPEQLSIKVKGISTRRHHRAATLSTLVATMAKQYEDQPGNYIAFFSSFDYMAAALAELRATNPHLATWAQQRHMSEGARQQYLERFQLGGAGIGFAVLGGVFSEGVDLPGKRLVGAFIATLGLPRFDEVNLAIAQRIEERFERGHDYTFLYPGMQKVVQAAGRVIRTESDTGVVLLLDERYLHVRYRRLLPVWWQIGLSA